LQIHFNHFKWFASFEGDSSTSLHVIDLSHFLIVVAGVVVMVIVMADASIHFSQEIVQTAPIANQGKIMSVSETVSLSVSFRKTVSESDVYLFAGITGDLSPNHVDEEFMKTTPYGGRIAHGALLVGYMSGCSTDIVAQCVSLKAFQPVSLGYDRIRFLKAVLIGDTIQLDYKISAADETKSRTIADITIHNQRGELCAVATHVMTWLKRP
jgi:3-hydroxybutyryl-CoA dehydratase